MAEARRILVVKLSSLGDTLHALPAVAELLIPLPVIELRKHLFHVCPCLFLREALADHMRDADVDQIVHIAVRVGTVCIAPLAVVLVKRAVLVSADDRVFKRHPAALTDQLMRRAEQRVDGHAEKRGQQF